MTLGSGDRSGRWMARWDGNNVFGGQYAPAEERSFSLPNVYSCRNQPGPFRAMATVGPYSALLNRLTYSQVTCTSGRLTESAVGGKVTVRIALGNNGQDVSNGGVSGRGHFTATGAIADRGSATTYRTVKGSTSGGVITLRIVTVGKKGAITYLITINTAPVRRGGKPAPARRHMTAFTHTASSARTRRTPPAPSSGLSRAKQLGDTSERWPTPGGFSLRGAVRSCARRRARRRGLFKRHKNSRALSNGVLDDLRHATSIPRSLSLRAAALR